LVEYKIKSLNPKDHIKVCSFVSYFMMEIVNESFGSKEDIFYAEFHVKSTEESFEILSEESGIILEFIPGKIVR
jgi:hypothetical protein